MNLLTAHLEGSRGTALRPVSSRRSVRESTTRSPAFAGRRSLRQHVSANIDLKMTYPGANAGVFFITEDTESIPTFAVGTYGEERGTSSFPIDETRLSYDRFFKRNG